MQKVLSFYLIIFMSLMAPICVAEDLPPLPKGPLLLTSVTPDQLTADYWVNRLPNPDRLLKTPDELQEFNEDIRMIVRDQIDVMRLEASRAGRPIRDQIEYEFETIRDRILYGTDGKRIQKNFFNSILQPRINLEGVPKTIKLRWGAATYATSVRALPTEKKMLEEVGDVEFDQLQFTLIKTWTPVAIYHTSADGRWYYVQAPYVRGWVRSGDIALFSSRGALNQYVKSPSFLMVTGESAPVFIDRALSDISQRASMGTFLPLAGESETAYEVWMPLRKASGDVFLRTSYISKQSDVSAGYLPYTQRNVINQAFKLLGARYGWGGEYQGRDCSGFTHDVFLTFGIEMPRNSGKQIFAGTQLGHYQPFEDPEQKIRNLEVATPGITLLRMKMHMMLYLGEVNGKFYIIHSTWAERIGQDPVLDEKRRLNQVVVSDLSLNGDSYQGPLFHRIISMAEIQ